MSGSRWTRYTALLAAGVFLAALMVPGVALALAGEPIPGAEIFLAQEPGDDPIFYDPDPVDPDYWGAREHAVNADCNVYWPAGAVPAGTVITATVGFSETGVQATDGGIVKRIVRFQPDGLTFAKDITLELTCPPGLSNARAYWLNPGTGKFELQASSRNGDKVMTDISHFSIYGVGGDPEPVSTPASSPWSLAVLALVGVALGAFVLYHTRQTSAGVGI